MLHVSLWTMALTIYTIGLTCPLFFLNSACLWKWNICIILRDNKLNQAFLIYYFYTEKLTEVLWNFQPMFNQIQPKFNGFVLGLWPTLPQTFMKIGAILYEISWQQTDRHRWTHNVLVEVVKHSYLYINNITHFVFVTRLILLRLPHFLDLPALSKRSQLGKVTFIIYCTYCMYMLKKYMKSNIFRRIMPSWKPKIYSKQDVTIMKLL